VALELDGWAEFYGNLNEKRNRIPDLYAQQNWQPANESWPLFAQLIDPLRVKNY
jgi:hypothetical protein